MTINTLFVYGSEVGMSKLCSFFFFNLLCYALIPELLPIKMCLLFLNYAAINHNTTNQRELRF